MARRFRGGEALTRQAGEADSGHQTPATGSTRGTATWRVRRGPASPGHGDMWRVGRTDGKGPTELSRAGKVISGQCSTVTAPLVGNEACDFPG